MRRVVSIVVVACSVLVSVPAVSAQTITEELTAVETELASALVEKDRDALDRLLRADFVLRGTPDTPRDAWIGNALSLCWGDRFNLSDVSVRSLSADTVVASLVLTTHEDPLTCRPATVRSVLTDVWVRDNGQAGWRLAIRHSGPVGSGVAGQFSRTPPPPPRWERTAELSLVATDGNTETQTLGAGAGLVWRPSPLVTRARLAYVRSEAGDVETAESLVTELRVSRAISPRMEVFARTDALFNRFAGIDYRVAVDAGLGWQVHTSARHSLKLDAAAGSTHEARILRDDLTFASASGGLLYTWKVSAATTVTEQALLTADLSEPENWRLQNGLSLTTSMTRMLSLRVSHELKRINRPVPGFRPTDTVLSAAVVATF